MGCCKTPIYTFSATLVGTDWKKGAWTAKKQNLWILPRWTTHQKYFTFFDHHCKGKVLTDIFYAESLLPTCLIWALWLLEWTQLVFRAHLRGGFPLKQRHSDVTGARNVTYLTRFGAVFRIRWCLHWLSSAIPSDIMADHYFVHQTFWRAWRLRVI